MIKRGEIHMSRKNHQMVNGQLLQMDKQYSALKQKQKEKIALWMYEETYAYYLQYQNRRPDYVEGWHKLIHWKKAGRRYEQVLCRLERAAGEAEKLQNDSRTTEANDR